MQPLRYLPYGQVDALPNVIVDGSPTGHTLLTLSHWPGTRTPAPLRADLSAQMAFRYLDRPDLAVAAEAVSNNHADQDGLVGVFALVDPAAAIARREILEDVAAAGDFGTYRLRHAARLAMALGRLIDDADDAYQELLPRLAGLCDDVDALRPLWEDEDARLSAGEAALAAGRVTVEEVPDLDLAVITVAPADDPVHEYALHNATRATTLLLLVGEQARVVCRYEGWVQYVSRTVRPRRDLRQLAARLNQVEAGGGRWVGDPPGNIVPVLRLEDAPASSLAPDRLRRLVLAGLAELAPAWDPSPSPP